jgi:hypothetical protein
VVKLICLTKTQLLMRSELCVLGFFVTHSVAFALTDIFFPVSIRAYKDSMDIQKHGGSIYLPQHLHENLSENNQQLLRWNNFRSASLSAESMRNGPYHQQQSTQNITSSNIKERGEESSIEPGQKMKRAIGASGQEGGMKKTGRRKSIPLEASLHSPELFVQKQKYTRRNGIMTHVASPNQYDPPNTMQQETTTPGQKPRGFNRPETPPIDPNVTKSGKRKRGQEPDQNEKKLKKSNHVSAQKLPKPLPGPGWECRRVMDYSRSSRLTTFWLPPSKRFGFRSAKNASDFEDMRTMYQGNEDKALVELKKRSASAIKIKPFRADISLRASSHAKILVQDRGGDTSVLSIATSSSKTAKSPPSPGLDWKSILVQYSTQNRHHWLSPIRRIEFKNYQAACKFESLRKKNGKDEVVAWKKYREYTRRNGVATLVVSPDQYDCD